ncbi:MAG TPA: maleylpyruvate isomerase family mycothiol-dependent enzyme [Acidimicrobiales bacterium]|nr:maleylpyruvate isomerase family mycothiol-dependent enzyme [Acidimicrobiales bacterium]
MDVMAHVAELRRNGDLLATAAAEAGPDAPVPPCPDWNVRDLVHHLGGVHRWATSFVDGRTDPQGAGLDEIVGTWPGDDELVGWFLEGCEALAASLASAPADLDCWTFLPAPTPLAMWARRQDHEAAIHRVDAELAAGLPSEGFSTDMAADGVDELLVCFVGRRRGPPPGGAGRTLAVSATDAGQEWLLTFGPEQIDVTSGSGRADCTLSGAAADLYLALWNRRGLDGIAADGDLEVVGLLDERLRIRWS